MVESWLIPDTPFFDLVTGIEAALNGALIFEIKNGGLMPLGTAKPQICLITLLNVKYM